MKVSLAAVLAVLSLSTLSACSQKDESDNSATAAQPSMAEPKTVSESGATTVAMYQASDEILLENLDSSDYPILNDIFASAGGGKSYCPDTTECTQFVFKSWQDDLNAQPVREMLDLAARKAYAESLAGQAPHLQQEIAKKAFTARYAKLQELIAGKNICFIYRPWRLEFMDDRYHISGGNGKHTSVLMNLKSSGNFEASVVPGDTYIKENGKFLAPIPAKIFGDENYKKYAAYAEKPSEMRPALKICGKPAGEYNKYLFSLEKKVVVEAAVGAPPEAPPELPALQQVANIFQITKPIEVVQPPTMKKIDTIPSEWFVSAQ